MSQSTGHKRHQEEKSEPIPSEKNKTDNEQENKGKIVIVGTGLIGRNWAVLFARYGNSVVLYDIEKSQLDSALRDIQNHKIPMLKTYNLLDVANPVNTNDDNKNDILAQEMLTRITSSTDLKSALKDATLVIEGIPEVLELKQKLFQEILDILNELNHSCIIGSSSSTFTPSKLIAKLDKNAKNIQNILITHPVNPPLAIPLVEIVPSPLTDPNVVQHTKNIMTSIGMKPIIIKKECDGFILNRLQFALLQLAYQLVEEEIASPQDIDLAVSHGLGLRWSFMGPFETIHLNAPKGVNDYCQRYYPIIAPVVATQNDELQWKPEVYNKIHQEMCKTIPEDKIGQRCQWRDKRLMELGQMKTRQDLNDAMDTLHSIENIDDNNNKSKTNTDNNNNINANKQ